MPDVETLTLVIRNAVSSFHGLPYKDLSESAIIGTRNRNPRSNEDKKYCHLLKHLTEKDMSK